MFFCRLLFLTKISEELLFFLQLLEYGENKIKDVQIRVTCQRKETTSLIVVKAGFIADETKSASMRKLDATSILMRNVFTMKQDRFFLRMKNPVLSNTNQKD